jgi:hypothetical protein
MNFGLALKVPCYNFEMRSERRSIAMVYKKVKLQVQETDFAFWQTQSYASRLEALEQIRKQYIAWKYDTQPRFQTVLAVTKQK